MKQLPIVYTQHQEMSEKIGNLLNSLGDEGVTLNDVSDRLRRIISSDFDLATENAPRMIEVSADVLAAKIVEFHAALRAASFTNDLISPVVQQFAHHLFNFERAQDGW